MRLFHYRWRWKYFDVKLQYEKWQILLGISLQNSLLLVKYKNCKKKLPNSTLHHYTWFHRKNVSCKHVIFHSRSYLKILPDFCPNFKSVRCPKNFCPPHLKKFCRQLTILFFLINNKIHLEKFNSNIWWNKSYFQW